MGLLSFSSNIASLGVQRRLGNTTAIIQSSFTRLSTGLRINKASDDAAGLAIADNLRVDTRLQSQAIRNINDGISMLNIMSGTLEQQQGITTRLLELAEQASNGTLSSEQRNALNQEYQSLVKEFGRLGESTKFNGQNLLLGTRGGASASIGLQAGITGSNLSQLSVQRADTGAFSGIINTREDSPRNSVPAGLQDSVLFSELDSETNHKLISTTITDSTGKNRDLLLWFTDPVIAGDNFSFTARVYQRVSDTGGVGAQSGMGVQGDVTSLSDEWVYAANATIMVSEASGKTIDDGILNANLQFDNQTVSGTLALDMRGASFSVSAGGGIQASSTSLNLTGTETAGRALDALTVVRARQVELSQIQGEFGAVGSRLETALNTLAVSRENTAAAESSIRDVDVATESASLVASQIRQQSAAQVLALANSQPELLLFLLTG